MYRILNKSSYLNINTRFVLGFNFKMNNTINSFCKKNFFKQTNYLMKKDYYSKK